jgi:hypothetical protein
MADVKALAGKVVVITGSGKASREILLGRRDMAEEIASMVRFLVGAEGRYITRPDHPRRWWAVLRQIGACKLSLTAGP